MADEVSEIKDKIDIVEFVNSYVTLKKTGRNFRALCPFHTEKTPSFFVSPERQSWHCFGCFPTGSLIKTKRGYHKIEDIREKEKVLTYKGRFMPVVRTLQRHYSGEVIDLTLRKSNEITSLTADHEVYVIKTNPCKYKDRKTRICQWNCRRCKVPPYLNYKIEKLPASQLSKNDYLLYPINQGIKNVDVLDLNNYYSRRESNFGPNIAEIPTKIKVDERLLKLIGYYIAEGSNHRAYIRFSLGNHEGSFALEIKSLIEDLFKARTTLHQRKKGRKTGLEITTCNSKLANIFENLCGKHAANKHIPFELQYLIPEKERIMLEAIHKGDGYQGKVSKCKKERRYKAITTVSFILAEQLRDILLRLNIAPTLQVSQERTDKNGVHHQRSFRIAWQESYLLNFSQFYSKNRILYWISPIKEIKKRYLESKVYNLTVAEDHSYVARNFVVSNCGKGGDVFSFLMEKEGLTFGEALRLLAERAGVKLTSKFPPRQQERKERLLAASHLAAEFYHYLLTKHRLGEKARQYLSKRSIGQQSIKDFKLGYSPASWESTGKFLLSRGFKIDELLETGLIIEKPPATIRQLADQPPTRTWYDRFRGRLMFPVFDVMNRVVGFSARTLENEEPKYLNSPDSAIFKKGNLLYGLNLGKDEIRAKEQTILVEGNLDVISSHQKGFKNVVAPLGTGVTEAHAKLSKRFAQKLTFCFDNDEAGEKATLRGIPIAQSENLEISVAQIRGAQDADELIRKDPKLFEKTLEQAKPAFDYLLHLGKEKFGLDSATAKKKIAALILPYLTRTPGEIEKDTLVKRLAEELGINEKSVWQDLTRESSKFIRQLADQSSKLEEGIEQVVTAKKPREILLAEHFLHLVLTSEETCWTAQEFQEIFVNIEKDYFAQDNLTEIWERVNEYLNKEGKISLSEIGKKLSAESQKVFDLLILRPAAKIYEKDSEFLADLKLTASELKKCYLRKFLQELSAKIRKAERDGKLKEIEELKKEFKETLGKMPK